MAGGLIAMPPLPDRPFPSVPVPSGDVAVSDNGVGAISEFAQAAETRRQEEKRKEKEEDVVRRSEMEGQPSSDIECSTPEQQSSPAYLPVPGNSCECGCVYHHRYDHLQIPNSTFEIIWICMPFVVKGQTNAEQLSVVSIYFTDNGYTYEIEVKTPLARLKPNQKPFFCFAQIFCELSYPADQAIDCCWSVHLHRAAVKLGESLNKFAAPAVAPCKSPKLPIDMAIAASSNEDAAKFRVSDVLFYLSKIAELVALVEAPVYELFRPIYNKQLPPPLRVQYIIALKLQTDSSYYNVKVKAKAILDYMGSGTEASKVELCYSFSMAEVRQIYLLVKFTRNTSDNSMRDAEALTKSNESMQYFRFLLSSCGIYFTSFIILSLNQTRLLYDMRFACSSCKNTFFIWYSQMEGMHHVMKSFISLWQRYFILAPTCSMLLTLITDNLNFAEVDSFRDLRNLSKFLASPSIMPAVILVQMRGYNFISSNENSDYSTTANGYVDKLSNWIQLPAEK